MHSIRSGWRAALLVAGIVGPGAEALAHPTEEVTLTRIPGTPVLELSGELPLSGPFTVRYAVRAETRSAILYVWPRAVQPDCAGEPAAHDAPQSHVAEMSLQDEGPRKWAIGTVPHLQANRAFCFRVQSTEAIALPVVDGAGLVAGSLASERIDDLSRWAEDLAGRILDTACAAARATAEPEAGAVRCEAEPWRAALGRRLALAVLTSPLPRARAHRATLSEAKQQADAVLRTALDRLPRLDAISDPPLDPRTVRTLDAGERAAARQALEASGRHRPWLAWLESFDAAATRSDRLAEELRATDETIRAAVDGLAPALDAAVADFLAAEVRAERRSPPARGDVETPDANNYLAPVYGVGVGLPAHSGELWLFTYGGVHLFAEPVERHIPFDQMVGGTMWQRLSLFVGALTSDPGRIDDARVEPGLAGAYPGLGLGWRVTRHVALDGMAFLYEATDVDPIQDRRTRGVTVSLGVTAELDIIQWLTPN